MTEYRFRIVIIGPHSGEITDEELLDSTDALGAAGCDDAAVSIHQRGLELEFDRSHNSLQEAIASAIRDIGQAGFQVEAIELDRETVIPVGA